MRDFLRQFMLYSRSERRAVIALTVLIVLAVVAPRAYHFYSSRADIPIRDTTLQSEIAQWQKNDKDDTADTSAEITNTTSAPITHSSDKTLFYFDPNTIGIVEWQKLGLSEKQAAGIEKYKSKGGKFRGADDLRKMYTLSDADKDRLVPYVRISGSELSSRTNSKSNGYNPSYIIEVNTADSAAYEALWGIGPVLSARIVKYRGLLGGFVSVDQVGEVYGIRDSVFMSIRPHLTIKPALVHKLNINEADYETLRKHPYLHAKLAKAIVGYRENNGKFESMEQLKQFKAVTDEVYQKIIPYLTL